MISTVPVTRCPGSADTNTPVAKNDTVTRRLTAARPAVAGSHSGHCAATQYSPASGTPASSAVSTARRAYPGRAGRPAGAGARPRRSWRPARR